METLSLLISLGTIAGHRVPAFHPGTVGRQAARSIGDQQACMALRACGESAASGSNGPRPNDDGLLCLHCGGEMRVLEGLQLGDSLHLSAECPRCGCLRASCVELGPAAHWSLELPAEASFD